MRRLSWVSIRLVLLLGTGYLWAVPTNTTLTVDGVTYDDVRWGEVRGNSVTVFHRSGLASIPLRKLPPEIQRDLGFDPDKAGELDAQPAKQAAAQEARHKELGYQRIRGRWVSPEEAKKYLGREATSQALQGAIHVRQTTRSTRTGAEVGSRNLSLLDLLQDINAFHELDLVIGARSEIIRLQKYGHQDYQEAARWFLGVCDNELEIYRECQKVDPEWDNAASEYETVLNRSRGRGASSADMALLQSLGNMKAKKEAFQKRITQLAEEARRYYREGIEAKMKADTK